jgi:hypothetical protein
MSLKKLKTFLSIFAFVAVMAVAGTVAVNADESRTTQKGGTRTTQKTEGGCDDYDRNVGADEEKTSGGCTGTVPTPEPVSIILFSAGLAGVGFAARRRLRKSE